MSLPSPVVFAETSIGDAVEIAVTGMLIVFVTLGLISLFLAWMPQLMRWINAVVPEGGHHHARPASVEVDDSSDDAVLAAIGFVVHSEMGRDQ